MAEKTFGAVEGKWSEAKKWSPEGVPAEGDDVVFDASSANCTVTAEAKCRSLNAEAYKKTLTIEAVEFKIGTSTSGPSGLALQLGTGMTLSGASSKVRLTSTSATVQHVKTNGIVLPGRFFTQESGKYQLDEKVECAGEITLTGTGEVKLNGQTLKSGSTITISSTVTVSTGGGSIITPGTFICEATATFNAESNTIECAGFRGGGKTYNKVILTASAEVRGSNTFAELEVTGTKAAIKFEKSTVQTITSSFKVTTSSANVTKLESTEAAKKWKIKKTSGEVKLEWVEIKDSVAEGGATFWDRGKSVSGNEGWEFANELTTSGKWETAGNWLNGTPAEGQDCFIPTGKTAKVEGLADTCRSLRIEGTGLLEGNAELKIGDSTKPNGGITLEAATGERIKGTVALEFKSTFTTSTLKIGGFTSGSTGNVNLLGVGVVYELTGAVVHAGAVKMEGAAATVQLETKGFAVESKSLVVAKKTKLLTGGTVWTCSQTTLTAIEFKEEGALTAGTGKFKIKANISNVTATPSFNEVELEGTAHEIKGAATFAKLILAKAGQTVKLQEGKTQTVEALEVIGSKAGELTKLESSKAGTAATTKLTKAVTVKNLSLKDIHATAVFEGTVEYEGIAVGEINVSGNEFWKFSEVSSVTKIEGTTKITLKTSGTPAASGVLEAKSKIQLKSTATPAMVYRGSTITQCFITLSNKLPLASVKATLQASTKITVKTVFFSTTNLAASTKITVKSKVEANALSQGQATSKIRLKTEASQAATAGAQATSKITLKTSAAGAYSSTLTAKSQIRVRTEASFASTTPIAGTAKITLKTQGTAGILYEATGASKVTVRSKALTDSKIRMKAETALQIKTQGSAQSSSSLTAKSQLRVNQTATITLNTPVAGSLKMIVKDSGAATVFGNIAGKSRVTVKTKGTISQEGAVSQKRTVLFIFDE